ncbi:hypothetical protein [Streptomyces sp. NPDC048357]|uniref:hypothetical protein n=1 Tax=Streptomyces sp. NPDC048357 TaxID=3154719 RepID=UPI003448921D
MEFSAWQLALVLAVLGLGLVALIVWGIVRIVRHAVQGTTSKDRAEVVRELPDLVHEVTRLFFMRRR